LVIEVHKVDVKLEIVPDPSESLSVACRELGWCRLRVWVCGAVVEGVCGLAEADDAVSEAEPVLVSRARRVVFREKEYGPAEGLA
jgi:hypothetical protein